MLARGAGPRAGHQRRSAGDAEGVQEAWANARPYSFKPDEKRPFPWESPPDPVEVAHEVFQAWLTFAMFDNARRGHLGIDLEAYRTEHRRDDGADDRRSRPRNPDAWFRVERSVEDLVAARPDNRMVGYPYTKYMVAVMDVDMAAAVLVATHANGRRARHRPPIAGSTCAAGATPRTRCSSPRGRRCGARPRWRRPRRPRSTRPESASTTSAHLDLYSCFGSSLHFACDALGISPLDVRGLTVTGGLPYHGGPGSGYLVHAIATMTDVLRS